MFLWSDQSKKTVTFKQNFRDQDLLAVVETELTRQPDKDFSDLCKEALRAYFCAAESDHSSGETSNLERQIAQLTSQIAGLEERLLAQQSSRLQVLTSQLANLSSQVKQLSDLAAQQPTVEIKEEATIELEMEPQGEIDPEISRLSQFLDDF